MIGFFCTLAALAVLTASYRLYDVYIRTVGREEARRRRRAAAARRHVGHKIFLLEHFCLAVAALVALRHWLPVFAFDRLDGLVPVVEMLLLSSGLLAVWLVHEGRFLQRFYQRILRATRTRGDGTRPILERALWGPRADRRTRVLIVALSAWSALPFLLALVGVHVITRSTPFEEALVILALWWALPLSVLAAIVTREILRVRNRILVR